MGVFIAERATGYFKPRQDANGRWQAGGRPSWKAIKAVKKRACTGQEEWRQWLQVAGGWLLSRPA
ncbi:hypothetical protein IAQ61_001538 [Plenodomus lingam]|uniref:Predicted protein n=1 Tax=Leptosphaeria maculans (strain JN3 / isolate v23.1.3 / race Av1-4-5-6-7-8) TaxID=985895 RepID=E4ZYC4_LEPMJ|nr:predicted protein [Plenodomus lingam JN3]KAH9879719.1 hypothetical protein IAQ61_001538 [Plenodomus lingam]CBX96369.1 predicted protein [Plenodomus lingam JN3]